MAQLAQAYIHFKPFAITAEQLQLLGRATEILAAEAAADAYEFGVTIDVELTEGSFIGRVTVIGTLIAAYGIVADYKGFKESSVELVKDARYVGDLVIDGIKALARPTPRQVYRTERRTKTPGKLYRIGQRLEKLDAAADQLSKRAIEQELAEIREELEKVQRDLTTAERRVVFKVLEFKNLPPISRWPRKSPEVGPDRVARRHAEELEFFEDDEQPMAPEYVSHVPSTKKPVYHNRIQVEPNDALRIGKELPDYQTRLQEIVQIASSTTSLTPLRTGRRRGGRRQRSTGAGLVVKRQPDGS
jgi:hypothetical protein